MLALWLTLLVALAPAGPRATTMHHPDWEWRTLHTEHFAIHFARSSDAAHPLHAEETARRVAAVADPLWLRMGDVLDWFPIEPLTVVVVDDTDALRAWAWPLRGAVVISAHPGFELPRTRGRGDPVLDVFAHELAHGCRDVMPQQSGAFS